MGASVFNRDISKWDVSNVVDMSHTFMFAQKFNKDISHWDISKVTKMTFMFAHAEAFKKKLCGYSWLQIHTQIEEVDKHGMFFESPGEISSSVCIPKNRELVVAIGNDVTLSSK